MITVVSGQPISSKWWWIGDMRNSRLLRPDALNTPICMATEPVSITLMPQMSSSSSWVLVRERQQRQRGADAERADVAHEDARRRRVPPQEAAHAPANAAANTRQVERVDHGRVDLGVAEAPSRR